jgi:hypothetical protein
MYGASIFVLSSSVHSGPFSSSFSMAALICLYRIILYSFKSEGKDKNSVSSNRVSTPQLPGSRLSDTDTVAFLIQSVLG